MRAKLLLARRGCEPVVDAITEDKARGYELFLKIDATFVS